MANTIKKGRLIAASLGPGDPGLITRAAWDVLQTAPCWAWPVGRKDGQSYALAIVERAGLEPPPGKIPLFFPMTRDLNELAASWLEAGQKVKKVLDEGVDVAFLVEGDASFFSTFGHLERTVRGLDPDLEIEIIPGVCSPLASAALEGHALCEGDERVAVVAATNKIDEIERMLHDFDAMVLMKVRPVLEPILDLLTKKDLLKKTVFVERAGTPDERIIKDVTELRGQKVHYLSLMIIHCNDGEQALGMNG